MSERKMIYLDDALDILDDLQSGYENGFNIYADSRKQMLDLSFAQPERKTGEWIWDENGMDWGLGAWCCSGCRNKAETWWASDKKYNPLRCAGGRFCGNCGAYMKGGES